MKERPILFSAGMVRAILEGRKTQTRRIVKDKHVKFIENLVLHFLDGRWNQRPMPYGQPGDRLWLRESWGLYDTEPKDGPENARVYYRATDGDRHELRYQKWRPSIHMPRWASRITLEITGVGVERLQDISEEDARREGCHLSSKVLDIRHAFRNLWENINGEESWSANPWVWVIEFKRLQP